MMIKYIGKCGDCIYAKPVCETKPSGEQICSWNHRRYEVKHECEMHSFFPKRERPAKTEEARKKADDFEYAYHDGKAEMAHDIINERFGMMISETDDEYIAENSVCSVGVRKEKICDR